jgi:hypothetical protein
MSQKRSKRSCASGLIIAAIIILPATSATAGDSLIDRWANRQVQGAFDTPKSSLALEWCIARQLPYPTVIHGEGITEIDSLLVQLGVRIADDDKQRTITFVANPRVNDKTAEEIRSCL